MVIDKSILKKEFDDCGSDKSTFHNYELAYSEILPDTADSILEIGIGRYNGKDSSIYAWGKIYPNIKIYAIDNVEEKLINENNISSFLADQYNRDSLINASKLIDNNLDIIIDDGVHLFEESIRTFEVFFPLLKLGGIYCIEDVRKQEPRWAVGHQLLDQFKEYFELHNIKYEVFDTKFGFDDDSIIILVRKI